MFSKIATSNILSVLLDNTSILNMSVPSIYNSMITKYSGFNIIDEQNQPIIGIINSDIIKYSQNIHHTSIINHVPSILMFHEDAPPALKKEDRYILYKKIKNTYKIFFSNKIKKSWSLPEDNLSYIVPYGFKTLKNLEDKPKNIAILNFHNNKIINQIYHNINKSFIGTDLITKIESYEKIINNISDYKIVVVIGDTYNTIACSACGCFVLSNVIIEDPIETIYYIENTENINHKIAQILQSFNNMQDNIEKTLSYIEKKYNLLQHINSINLIFNKLKNRPYIYES